jgi:hypothetical protein
VWWRLYDAQDRHCATCPGPAEVIDHCHTSGLVRGLLCYACNHSEALHARDLAVGLHPERCWFEPYWEQPPAAPFGWYWPYEHMTTSSFLTEPPAWAPRHVRVVCPPKCPERVWALLADGVHLAAFPGR